MRNGRPPKPNSELELTGSRNKKENQVESPPAKEFDAPSHLSTEGKYHWKLTIAPLLESQTLLEMDKPLAGCLCDDLGRFHDRSINTKTLLPNIDEKERQRIGKRILEYSISLGMNPISRARSGVSKKVTGVKQRPP